MAGDTPRGRIDYATRRILGECPFIAEIEWRDSYDYSREALLAVLHRGTRSWTAHRVDTRRLFYHESSDRFTLEIERVIQTLRREESRRLESQPRITIDEGRAVTMAQTTFSNSSADAMAINSAAYRQIARELQQSFYDHLTYIEDSGFLARERAARERARQLFIKVAGEEAYRALTKYDKLYLKGSLGGEYHMSCGMIYNIHDLAGNQYCAQVKNVPLWDHLLGLKLTIENNEGLFLKKANISRKVDGPIRTVEVNMASVRMRQDELLSRNQRGGFLDITAYRRALRSNDSRR